MSLGFVHGVVNTGQRGRLGRDRRLRTVRTILARVYSGMMSAPTTEIPGAFPPGVKFPDSSMYMCTTPSLVTDNPTGTANFPPAASRTQF
jgi:hypothetical protein